MGLIQFEGLHRKKDQKSQVWWLIPAIPATQEVEVGGYKSKTSLDKSLRPYLKKI
jgi:hypothetical protein